MSAFLSVAIPTFGRPDLLERAVRSVMAQDYQDWEIVISDDEKGNGETWSAGERFAAMDRRIRTIKNGRGQGQAANTNNAMLEGQSPWIKLLHDDDWLAPGALRRFAELAARYPEAPLISCAANLVMNDGTRLYKPSRRYGRETVLVQSYQAFLVDLYLLNVTKEIEIAPSTILIKRSALTEDRLMRHSGAIPDAIDKPFFMAIASAGEVVLCREGLIFYDATNHSSVSTRRNFEFTDREVSALKRMIFDLIEDKAGLPSPDTIDRAQRIARVRSRLGRQPWSSSVKQIAAVLNPKVSKLIADRLMGWGPYGRKAA